MKETNTMEQVLDNFYQTDREKYEERLGIIKSMGCRVFRNSEGKHIIKYDEDALMKQIDKYEEERNKRQMKAFMEGFLGKKL